MLINHWFTAVVEDINDPLQMGRVRIRAFSYHTSDQTDLPTEDLPWSTCIMPVTSASLGGIGVSPVGLLPGSWVFGFFRDGNEAQDAVIVGSFPSSSQSSELLGQGFMDPNGNYPNVSGPDIPAGATSYGYSNNESYFNQVGASQHSNSVSIGTEGSASTFQGPPVNIPINAAGVEKLVLVARSQIGIKESSMNQGAGIQKFWEATNYKSGYNDRAPWCAAFAAWCVQQSGIFSETDRPKSASAFKDGGFEAWAKSKSSVTKLQYRPTTIKKGDLVIFSFSHIGIASTDSIGSAFKSIDGNTGDGVYEKNRTTSIVRSSITIG